MILFLTVVSGIAWTVVYVDAVRIGFRDQSYAIPAAALAYIGLMLRARAGAAAPTGGTL